MQIRTLRCLGMAAAVGLTLVTLIGPACDLCAVVSGPPICSAPPSTEVVHQRQVPAPGAPAAPEVDLDGSSNVPAGSEVRNGSRPDRDSDGDGVPDRNDECPPNPNKSTRGPCGCGVDVDTDGDGVPNCLDGCPNDPRKTLNCNETNWSAVPTGQPGSTSESSTAISGAAARLKDRASTSTSAASRSTTDLKAASARMSQADLEPLAAIV